MKLRKNKQSLNKAQRSPGKRYINESEQFSYTDYLDQTVNNPQIFSWADPNRQMISQDLMRNYYDNMIRTNGIELAYFRKYNTFF